MGDVVTTAEGHAFELRPVSCPTCGEGAVQRTLGMRGGKYHRYGSGAATRVVQCRTCSLIFPNPFPFPLDAQKLYGDPEKYFEAKDEGSRVEQNRAIVRELIAFSGRADPSLLDVGSGRGELLAAARKEGLRDVVGLELSDAMADYAHRKYGVTVLRQVVEDFASAAGRYFDIVVLNAVLEHVHQPNATVAAISRLTGQGAVLYVDVPNEPSLLTMVGNTMNRALRRQGVYNLSPTWTPYHVYGFNPKALSILLRKHGFRPVKTIVRANPHVCARDQPLDQARAFVATQINRFANRVGLASNMYTWAVREAVAVQDPERQRS